MLPQTVQGRVQGGSGIDSLASHSPVGKGKLKQKEKGFEYVDRNKGKLSRQVTHCNFYLVERFSIRFHFSNCNILGTHPINSVTPIYQLTALKILVVQEA